ncbi:hypothetical protein AVEN_258649-1 [Araneus ventricosus]|uniref:F-box domain-containing protein n=1 Tax=Araneus ventricosus TaxID=182803 RepID=A0A4Y2JHL1_ARAVE|nr:hypothetical protein AVEN_258649-1 [Araneus ventricosus]
MLPSGLYRICLQRICELLKEGTWKTYSTNPFWLHKSPFSDLPTEIVDDLMKFAQSHFENLCIADVLLLLTSGRLTRLDLSPFDLQKECDIFQKVMRSKGFQSLRFIARCSNKSDSLSLINTLICNCQNLEVMDVKCVDRHIISSALENCLKLTSVLYSDSLDALETIKKNRRYGISIPTLKIYGHIRLLTCVWGRDDFRNQGFQKPDSRSSKLKFLQKVRNAVSLCPFVENLHIFVLCRESIIELKELKRLTVLNIDLRYCDGVFLPDFAELLRIIGPQLKELTVICKISLPVDIICCSCPNLQALKIYGKVTASNFAKTNGSLLLEYIYIFFMDKNAVLFLLPNCKRLAFFKVCSAEGLDDNLLDRIMKINPLSYLKYVEMTRSYLSKNGFRRLLKQEVSL